MVEHVGQFLDLEKIGKSPEQLVADMPANLREKAAAGVERGDLYHRELAALVLGSGGRTHDG